MFSVGSIAANRKVLALDEFTGMDRTLLANPFEVAENDSSISQ
jgi:hypothetical protein